MSAFSYIKLTGCAHQLRLLKSYKILLHIRHNIFQFFLRAGNPLCFAFLAHSIHTKNNQRIHQHIAIVLPGYIKPAQTHQIILRLIGIAFTGITPCSFFCSSSPCIIVIFQIIDYLVPIHTGQFKYQRHAHMTFLFPDIFASNSIRCTRCRCYIGIYRRINDTGRCIGHLLAVFFLHHHTGNAIFVHDRRNKFGI